jgi:predicted cupin superfamily sugar epimerase
MERWIGLLGLQPHPEGGFFRETFRSSQRVTGLAGAQRDASTAIYFLLPSGTFSAFHVIYGADELWHHYVGDPVELHTIAPDGEHRVAILGPDVRRDERPQLLVPAGTLQAAVPRGSGFALCGCTVTPGFEFADFTMPARDELVRRFPRSTDVILRLTRT